MANVIWQFMASMTLFFTLPLLPFFRKHLSFHWLHFVIAIFILLWWQSLWFLPIYLVACVIHLIKQKRQGKPTYDESLKPHDFWQHLPGGSDLKTVILFYEPAIVGGLGFFLSQYCPPPFLFTGNMLFVATIGMVVAAGHTLYKLKMEAIHGEQMQNQTPRPSGFTVNAARQQEG